MLLYILQEYFLQKAAVPATIIRVCCGMYNNTRNAVEVQAQIQLLVTSPRQLARMVRRPKGAPELHVNSPGLATDSEVYTINCLISGGRGDNPG